MSKTNIFILGATGYIGGSVLTRLVAHPNAGQFSITALVRSAEKGKLLDKFGVTPVLGSLSDLDLLQSHSEQAHVVFSCANCDDLPSIEAILRGLKKRQETTGDTPVLIHTSGTAVVGDKAHGMYVSDKIWSDMNLEALKSIPIEAPHHEVDLAVVHADEEGYVNGQIVVPSMIFDQATGPLVEAGIVHPYSIAIPAIAAAAISRGRVGFVGAGLSVWPVVSISDTADFYIYLFDKLTTDPKSVGRGWEAYYFVENGECSWKDIAGAVNKALVELGVIEHAEPEPYTDEELNALSGGSQMVRDVYGSNARCRADRARSLGWKPVHTLDDMYAGIKLEVEAAVKRSRK